MVWSGWFLRANGRTPAVLVQFVELEKSYNELFRKLKKLIFKKILYKADFSTNT